MQNINLVKRHTKPNPQANQPGGIVEREAPIHPSNVMLFNPTTEQGRSRRLQDARGWPQGPRSSGRAAKSWIDDMTARLQRDLQERDRPEAHGAARAQESDAGAAHHQDHAQHGRRRGAREQEGPRERARRHDQDRGPEAGVDAGAHLGRDLQDPRRLAIGCKVTLRARACTSSSIA